MKTMPDKLGGAVVLAFFRISASVLYAFLDPFGVTAETPFSQLTKCPEATEPYQAPKYSLRSAHQEPFEGEGIAVQIDQYDAGY